MTPAFQITADGTDITAQINDRLLEISVTDEAGMKADALDIRIDDRDGVVVLPRQGAKLSVSMGYKGASLAFMGTFISDEITLSSFPMTMAIRAQSADIAGPIKEPKTRNWDKITVQAILEKIAGEHGLKPAIDKAKGAFNYKHLAQTNESDLHLITRLAKEHDAIAAIKDGNLVFAAKGAGKSASGSALSVRNLVPGDITSWSVTLTNRDKYKSVSAFWQDKKKAKKQEVKAGSGEPIYSIRNVYPTKEEAEKGVKSKLDEFTRGSDKLSITMPGDPTLAAETPLMLSGFRDGVDGAWSAISVKHTQNGSSYVCQIEAEKPTGDEADEKGAGSEGNDE
jgi:uncharacterized protein